MRNIVTASFPAFDAEHSRRINIEFSRPKAEKHSRPEAGNQRASAARIAGRRMLVLKLIEYFL